ncbi:MAG: TonB-dependent receptor [Vicinamibacterales bacterium]
MAWPIGARAQDTTGVGTLTGTVATADGTPAEFVTICLSGTARCVLSAANGEFRVDGIRAGDYRIEVSAPDQPSFETEPVSVRAGVGVSLEVTLPRPQTIEQAVTVVGAAAAVPQEIKASSYLIEQRQIGKDAGSLQDVSRFLQSLPGVVPGSADFRNDIIVRGGSPLENLFIVDNVEVPNINSFANFASAGGQVSILDAAMIRDVTFLTGGYPSAFANRASSVLQIAQREGNRKRTEGRATVGFAGAGGIVEGPLNGGKGSWIVSARRSFLDFFTKDVGFGGVPVAYTLNGKVVYDLGERDRLWAVNISGVDNIRLGRTEDTTDVDEVFNLDIRYRGWRSASGLNWQHVFGDRGVGLLGVTHSSARVRSTVKDLVSTGMPSDLPADVLIAQSPVVFREDSGEDETTVKYDFTRATRRVGRVQTGGSIKVFNVQYDAAAPFGSDNPFAPSGDADAFAIDRRLTTAQTGGYLQTTADVSRRVDVTVGARFDHYARLDAARISPRASGRIAITSRLSIHGATGSYYQQPPFLFLTAFPENERLRPLRADHYVGGLRYQIDPRTRVSVEVYRKNYSDYPVARDYPQLSFANIGDTFNVRQILFPLVSEGTGRATGIELYAERRGEGRWYGQANLSFSRARHAGLDGILRPGSFDYPLIVNATGGVRLGSKWELASRVSYLSGRPYTPFDEAQSRAQRRGVFDLSRVNGVRAPFYFRADLRLDRTFTVNGRPLLVFLGVQNVTNRKNFTQAVWNRAINGVDPSESLGAFPLVGMEWRF